MNDVVVRTAVLSMADSPPALDALIEQTYREVFPFIDANNMAPNGVEWGGNERYRVLAWVESAWVGILEITERNIEVGETPVRVGGIGGVMTVPAYRGMGVGVALMQTARHFICQHLRADFAMLFCKSDVRAFYSGLGWQPIDGRTLHYQQRNGAFSAPPVQIEHAPMILACAANQPFPTGDINLKGKHW